MSPGEALGEALGSRPESLFGVPGLRAAEPLAYKIHAAKRV
jgi:hypothetical protein